MEEKENTIYFHLSQEMHYDIINNHLDFITSEIRTFINKNLTVKTVYNPDLKKLQPKSIGKINQENIEKVFRGHQIS